jgi:hypothetical protein
MKNLVLKETQAPYTLTLDEAMLDEGPVRVLRVEGENECTIGVLVPPEEYAAFCAWQEAQQRPQQIQQASRAFEREVEAFAALWPELLQKYRGRVVAIYGGQIVEVGHPQKSVADVAGRVYERLGYVPVYLQRVEEPPRVYKITGPRLGR